jgi:hypothetical protein
MSVDRAKSGLRGTVAVSYAVTHRLALSRATEGWSEDERAALLRGDPEAREGLATAVWLDGKSHGFDLVEDDFIDLRIDP